MGETIISSIKWFLQPLTKSPILSLEDMSSCNKKQCPPRWTLSNKVTSFPWVFLLYRLRRVPSHPRCYTSSHLNQFYSASNPFSYSHITITWDKVPVCPYLGSTSFKFKLLKTKQTRNTQNFWNVLEIKVRSCTHVLDLTPEISFPGNFSPSGNFFPKIPRT